MQINSVQSYSNELLNEIIDDLHPDFMPVSDENIDRAPMFSKIYLYRKTNEHYIFDWEVFGDTPETVRTIFHGVSVWP